MFLTQILVERKHLKMEILLPVQTLVSTDDQRQISSQLPHLPNKSASTKNPETVKSDSPSDKWIPGPQPLGDPLMEKPVQPVAQESLIVSGNNPEPISVPHINISGVDAFENGNTSSSADAEAFSRNSV